MLRQWCVALNIEALPARKSVTLDSATRPMVVNLTQRPKGTKRQRTFVVLWKRV